MTLEKAKATFFVGIFIFFTGAAGFLLPVMSAPWPRMLMLVGLFLVNAGLFVMGNTVELSDAASRYEADWQAE